MSLEWYDKSMTTSKVAVSVPTETLRLARREVRLGHAKSLSSLVSDAIEEKLRTNELTEILDAMDAEYGKPNKQAKAWAKRVLRRSSSMQGR
jgi:hypothetical protein